MNLPSCPIFDFIFYIAIQRNINWQNFKQSNLQGGQKNTIYRTSRLTYVRNSINPAKILKTVDRGNKILKDAERLKNI
jgi:hypothetical protein